MVYVYGIPAYVHNYIVVEMCERLQTPDPFNPGCGPTRYLPPIKKDEDFDKEENRRKLIAKKREKIKKEMVEASVKTKKILNDAYVKHCRGIRAYVQEVKQKGVQMTIHSPYHENYIEHFENQLKNKKRRAQLVQRKNLMNSLGNKDTRGEMLLTADVVKNERDDQYRLALQINFLAEKLSTTFESELELRSAIELECQHAEINFPILAIHFSKQQEAGLDSISSSSWRPSVRSRTQWRDSLDSFGKTTSLLGPETKGINAEDSTTDQISNYKIGSKAFRG